MASYSKWFKGLRGRLLALVTLGAVTTLAITGYLAFQVNKLGEELEEFAETSVPKIEILADIDSAQKQLSISLLEALAKSDLEKRNKALTEFDEHLKEVQDGIAQYKEHKLDEMDQKLLAAFEEKFNSWTTHLKTVEGFAKKGTPEAREAAHQYLEKHVDELEEAITASIDKLQEDQQEDISARSKAALSDAHFAKKAAPIAGGLGVLCFLFVGLVTAAQTAKKIMEQIELLSRSSTEVTAASTAIASTSEELSQATTEQAASLQETAASIEQMSSMIKKNSDNAKQSADTSGQSKSDANRGQEIVEKMVSSMGEINQSNNNIMTQVNQSNAQLGDIVKIIEEIGTKTKVINDIVFQTKLLSFNASVEAARAGENGKGFAVVAEEVGNLAQMSGNAAREITDMLQGSIQKVQSIVGQTKSSVEALVSEGKLKVEEGTRIANECGQILGKLVESVTTVSQMSSEISAASQEQSQGIHEITKAMSQLDAVTQQNTAASQQAASAAEELSAQAAVLNSAVIALMAVIDGSSSSVNNDVQGGSQHRPPGQKRARTAVYKQQVPTQNDANNVIPLKTAAANTTTAPKVAAPAKKVVGSAIEKVPAYDDPGFRDV